MCHVFVFVFVFCCFFVSVTVRLLPSITVHFSLSLSVSLSITDSHRDVICVTLPERWKNFCKVSHDNMTEKETTAAFLIIVLKKTHVTRYDDEQRNGSACVRSSSMLYMCMRKGD